MELFQSWADTVLIFALAISNILFVVTLKREIKSLKSRNEELERTNKAALDLADGRAKDIEVFKGMYDPDYFKKYLEIHVKVEVEKATSKQQANLDNAQIKELLEYIDEAAIFISFYVHAEKKYDREKRISFFHTFFDKSKDLFWAVTNAKIEKVEKKISQNQLKNPDA